MSPAVGSVFIDIDWAGAPVRIEHAWIVPAACLAPQAAPLIVFLHEGLGSVAMWRDFPQAMCDAAQCRGLVYSRPGYGRSTPRPAGEHWAPNFLHRQAHEVLPALLQTLGIGTTADEAPPLWLLGHSDGGSIALLHAAAYPRQVAGAIVLAPHIMVEDIAIASIQQAREAYLHRDLRARLARYHDDVDSAFWGWNDVWLSAAFRSWAITDDIGHIGCPLLAVQGLGDPYGTLEQIHGIARRLLQTALLELADCGHSPHRDQPGALIAAATRFMQAHASRHNAPAARLHPPSTGDSA